MAANLGYASSIGILKRKFMAKKIGKVKKATCLGYTSLCVSCTERAMTSIQKLIKEISDLEYAKDLLEKVYLELGPYRDGKIRQETWQEVQNYFGFDDSE